MTDHHRSGRLERPAVGQANATRALLIALPLLAWLATTSVFWLGYVGTDDLFYSRYAALWHRPPINWWEFRMPAILTLRASFLTLGVSEFAAALPSLIGSLLILAAVALFVNWPRTLNWQAQAAMVMAATFPLDVGLRSVPGASMQAAGLFAFGAALIVKGRGRVPLVGACLLALAFTTHEIHFFHVAILCFTLLAIDRHRFWRPVLTCVLVAGLMMVAELGAYAYWLDDPLARFRTSAGTTGKLSAGFDPDTGIGGLRFYLWPLQNLAISHAFGPTLGLLLISGIVGWRRLTRDQRILFLATFLIWGYLAYGSQVPWAYKPLYRQFHYYSGLVLGVCALLPATLAATLRRPQWLARLLAYGVIAVNVALCALAGPWGQEVDVSRELLTYARANPDRSYVTDVTTWNHMYALNGFRPPENVVCLNDPATENHLLTNKEPLSTPRHRFDERALHGILLNPNHPDRGVHSPELERFKNEHAPDGARSRIAPLRYRMLVSPFASRLGSRDFLLRSRGGEVIEFDAAVRP